MSRDEEVAARSLNESIIAQAFAAAEAYPTVKILCPWCTEGVMGSEFGEHAKMHVEKSGLTAIILAGGKGTRLAPFPAPKCLLPVNGVPIIHRLLQHLLNTHKEHVSQAVICTGYRAGDVERSVGASDNIKFSNAGEDASMGKRLLMAREHMMLSAKSGHPMDRVLVCYGDDMADVDIAELVAAHESHEGAVGVTFTAALSKIPGGMINFGDKERIITENESALMNIGFALIEPACWKVLAPEDGLSDWINKVEAHPELPGVSVYVHSGKRATINSLADLAAAEEIFQ